MLVDYEIRALADLPYHPLVHPYNEELLNPQSLDVRVGRTLLVESMHTHQLEKISIHACTREEPFLLPPNCWCLAHTMEEWQFPANIAGQFVLKSSRAREGYEHANAGFIDGGFGLNNPSVLTLELKNIRQWHSLPIWPGLLIGQIKFFQTKYPLRSYEQTGRYNGDLSVAASKG
jgi:dCTP deaminase